MENMKTLQDIFTKLKLLKEALIRLSDKGFFRGENFLSRIRRLLKNDIVKSNAIIIS